MRNPRATAPANTSPQGRSIDFHTIKLMLTKLAFWTEMRAMRMIQVAVIVEITKFVIAFTFSHEDLDWCVRLAT